MTDDMRDAILTDSAAPLPLAAPRADAAGLFGRLGRHGPLAQQFFQFGVVGTIGFLVDNAVVYTAHFGFGLGLIQAGLISFFIAATINWILNRIWTFRGASTGRLHHEWLRYLGTNAVGFVLNRGAYIALIATSPLCVAHPVLALAAGSIAGLGVNFVMARRVVFR
jgi:putative flippase GtrA